MVEKISRLKLTVRERPVTSQMPAIGSNIYRPNLCYEVVRVSNEGEKQLTTVRLLKETSGTGIIYVTTIKVIQIVTDYLKRAGFDVGPYHHRLSVREREENYARLISGELKAVVTTNSLDLGLDRLDARFVIHYHAPCSLEVYYQESVRAGCDGNPVRCVLLFQPEDYRTHLFFPSGRRPGPNDAFGVYEALQRLKADKAPVSLERIQDSADEVSRTDVRLLLSLLKNAGLVREYRGARFGLQSRGLSAPEVERMAEESRSRSVSDRQRVERMMLYGQSPECRWKLLLGYLSEEERIERCGHCDNCLHLAAGHPPRSHNQPKPHFPHPLPVFDQRPEEKIEKIMPGDIVRLPEHGEVRVEAVEGDKIVVSFPSGETKKFKQEWVIR